MVGQHDLTISRFRGMIGYRLNQRGMNMATTVWVASDTNPLAGDFNAVAGSDELQNFMLDTGLINPNREDQPTYPAWKPKRQLDYLLHSPEIIPEHFEIPQVVYSDHLPLLMDFKIRHKRTTEAGSKLI